MLTHSSFEKYKTNIDDVEGKRKYNRNILQWCKNDFKSKNNTNGDYYCHFMSITILNFIEKSFFLIQNFLPKNCKYFVMMFSQKYKRERVKNDEPINN